MMPDARHRELRAQLQNQRAARGPRYAAIPDDGEYHLIEAYPLILRVHRIGEPKRCDQSPDPPQRVRAITGTNIDGVECRDRWAIDEGGFVYLRYDYPYGWVPASHVSSYLYEGLRVLRIGVSAFIEEMKQQALRDGDFQIY